MFCSLPAPTLDSRYFRAERRRCKEDRQSPNTTSMICREQPVPGGRHFRAMPAASTAPGILAGASVQQRSVTVQPAPWGLRVRHVQGSTQRSEGHSHRVGLQVMPLVRGGQEMEEFFPWDSSNEPNWSSSCSTFYSLSDTPSKARHRHEFCWITNDIDGKGDSYHVERRFQAQTRDPPKGHHGRVETSPSRGSAGRVHRYNQAGG